MMPSNTFCETVEELEKAFNEDHVAWSSPYEKIMVKEYNAIKKESPETKHGEGSCEHEAYQSSALQHQHQVCSLDTVKIEKTEPFFHEEKHNAGSSKNKNDGRSLSSDLYRISLYNLIKLEPLSATEQTSAKTKNIQDIDCNAGSSASQSKNVRNKRKHFGSQKNKTKKTKQRAPTSKQKHQGDLVTNTTNGIEVPCAKNATCEVPSTNKTVDTPASSGQKNAPIMNDMPSPENNHMKSKSRGSDKARSISVNTQTSIKCAMESVIADMPASENSHVTFNSVAYDKTKSVTANTQTNNNCEMQPNLLDTYAGEQQCVARSSEMPMPFTNNQETNANSFEDKLYKCKNEKQEDKKGVSSGHWSCDQRRGRQRSSGINHDPWQRRNRPSYPHLFPSFWRTQHCTKRKQNEGNWSFLGSVWQNQAHGWQNQGNLWENEGYLLENSGNVWHNQGNRWCNQGNGCHNQENGLHDGENGWCNQGGWHNEGRSLHSQGNGWPSQGNSWHNQGNGWPSQVISWHNQGNGWPSQGNSWHNQGNGWYNQRNELQNQRYGFNDQGSRKQNMGNGWHNLRSNIQSQSEGQQNRQSSWQNQAYQNQNRIGQNQSSSSLNHTCIIQNSKFSQQNHNSKMLDNKSYETEGKTSSKQNKLFDRQVEENIPSLNKTKVKCSTFTKQTGDVQFRDNESKADPQDESDDVIECKIFDEINGKESPENGVVVQVQHTRKKRDQNDKDNKAEVQLHDDQHLNCCKSDTVKIEQDIIYIPSEGSLKPEETAGCSIHNSSLRFADENVEKTESSENSEDDNCFANSGVVCADDDDDECIIINSPQYLHSSWSDDILDKTGSPLGFSTGSRKHSNLEEEIEIVWENVNDSNLSDSSLVDIP